MAENNAWSRNLRSESYSRSLSGQEKSHQLDMGSQLKEGGVSPPERQGICIIPSRRGPWRPMTRQARDQNSELRENPGGRTARITRVAALGVPDRSQRAGAAESSQRRR